jgi:dTDP-4-amino-4,6-dideoxygalactose transaminase
VFEHWERAITPRTRAILVAHLFGACAEMVPIVDFARQHDLRVVEDCAQAFVGSDYAGHPDADCSLFSFGPIKTATALGGAVLRVRDSDLRRRMANLQRAYPVQSRWNYLQRLAKYAGFRYLGKPTPYGLLVRALSALGIDYDRALAGAAHSFAPSDFFTQIRRQPCVPLVRLLERRLRLFQRRGAAQLRRRAMRGHLLSTALPPGMVLGDLNLSHTFWVNPIRVANSDEVIAALRNAGFDATARSSLMAVPRVDASGPPLARWLADTVFLPGGEAMSDRQWEHMIEVVARVASPLELPPVRELVALPSVSLST